jgi:hypothetical protein
MSVRYPINSTVNFDGVAQLFYAVRYNVPNAAGSEDGAAVTTAVEFLDVYGNGVLPEASAYGVLVTASQACMASVTNKTASGFDVVLTPPSGVQLAAGTFDLFVAQ